MVFGLTGSYCAGKNVVAELLAARGWCVIDEDAIGHEALIACRDRIISEFGGTVRDASGRVSRRSLGRIVFASPDALARLEAIVHPWMIEETLNRVARCGADNVVVNAAVLFKMGLHEYCDKVIIVRACIVQRVCRCLRRDGLPPTQILRRFRAQRGLNRAPKDVDTVIVRNTGSKRRLARRVARALP